MDATTQAQSWQLKSSVHHQRYAILALSAVVAIGELTAATRPVGDASSDKITCKEWVFVAKDGKKRIGAVDATDDGGRPAEGGENTGTVTFPQRCDVSVAPDVTMETEIGRNRKVGMR